MRRISQTELDTAVERGILSAASADALWSFLSDRQEADQTPRFDFTHVLYYLGGMLAIGAMSLFMTLGWERFGGWGIFFIALAYMGVALGLARRFERENLLAPMGIMATLFVVLVPLAVWGLQNAFGLWPPGGHDAYRDYHAWIDWRWITLEAATLVAGALMLWRWRAPFLVLPVAVTLWYMSMDLAVFFAGADTAHYNSGLWEFRQWFSLGFGLAMLAFALLVELRSRGGRDYPFWLHLFGLITFWGALSSMHSDLLSGKLTYLAINLALIVFGALLVRSMFAVFGGLGTAMVLGDLAWRYFKDSWLFPIALTAIGLAVVFAGVAWKRRARELSEGLRDLLPAELAELLAARQRAR
ncbi:hypothetical protein [Niveibacterium terrae]|uniref:hypothetical protein n=1 Tax=Niveibacterium terrae TaxID=3373598 RepID=UPI003A911728